MDSSGENKTPDEVQVDDNSSENGDKTIVEIEEDNRNEKATQTNHIHWDITIYDQKRYEMIFRKLNRNNKDEPTVSLSRVKEFLIEKQHLKKDFQYDFDLIWNLCDRNMLSVLTRKQFTIFMWLVEQKDRGIAIPIHFFDEAMPDVFKSVLSQTLNEESSADMSKGTSYSNDLEIKYMKEMMNNERRTVLNSLMQLHKQAETLHDTLFAQDKIISTEIEKNNCVFLKLKHIREQIFVQQEQSTNNLKEMRKIIYELNDMYTLNLSNDTKNSVSFDSPSNTFKNLNSQSTPYKSTNPFLQNDVSIDESCTDDMPELMTSPFAETFEMISESDKKVARIHNQLPFSSEEETFNSFLKLLYDKLMGCSFIQSTSSTSIAAHEDEGAGEQVNDNKIVRC